MRVSSFAAWGPYTVYPDGSIVRTICNPKLDGMARALTASCLPRRVDQKWGDDDWVGVRQSATEYINFLRTSYGHEGYEVPRLALALALASPLLVFTADAPFNDHAELPAVGFVVSMYSTSSGVGKSSLQEAVAAAYGKPELKRSGKKSSMTDVAAMTLAKSMGIYPFILDEVTQNDAKQAATLIDTFANGSGKIRATSDGTVRQSAATWALITLMSTNVPQRELVLQDQKQSDALQMRLLELDFDGLKPAGDQDAFSRGLKDVSTKCGAFGLLLARLVVTAGQGDVMAMTESNMRRAYVLLGVEQKYRFFVRGLAAMMTMNQLLGPSAPFVESELLGTFRNAVDATTTFVTDNKATPSQELARLVNHLSPNVVVTRTMGGRAVGEIDTALNPQVRLPLLGREVQEWGVVMLDAKAVREWCATNQMSVAAFLAGVDAAGLLVKDIHGHSKIQKRLTTGLQNFPNVKSNYYIFRTRKAGAEGKVVNIRGTGT